MNEKLLQYLWNFKIFNNFDFKDTEGHAVEILDFGRWNFNSGPDFLLAKIKYQGLILVGNIELHLKSSDFIFHNHSNDKAFDNLILHVVYHDDTEVDELKNKKIPTLELKQYINAEVIKKHEILLHENQFIPCEKIFDTEKTPFNFCEETLLKKLNEKANEIDESLKRYKNNYEAVLFHHMAYAFGLKINSPVFKQIAENIDFSVIQKIKQNHAQLEALLFGKASWLENPTDEQTKIWKREFEFLQKKFFISEIKFYPKFLRLRPPNFPTIRLSQLANLYYREQNLFSKIIEAKNGAVLIKIFEGISASQYWDKHFTFGKETAANKKKILSKNFIDLIIINAILPLKYAYHRNHNEESAEEILEFYQTINPENNTIIEGWKKLGASIQNAGESQAYIYHYQKFCILKNCLNCSIGLQLLKC